MSLGDHLASGNSFQPMTLCKIDCGYGKKKNSFWKKIILKFCILVIHCIRSIGFSLSVCQLPSQGSSGVLPKTLLQYSFQYSLQIEVMGLFSGCCQKCSEKEWNSWFEDHPVTSCCPMWRSHVFRRNQDDIVHKVIKAMMSVQGRCIRILTRNISTMKIANFKESLLTKEWGQENLKR